MGINFVNFESILRFLEVLGKRYSGCKYFLWYKYSKTRIILYTGTITYFLNRPNSALKDSIFVQGLMDSRPFTFK